MLLALTAAALWATPGGMTPLAAEELGPGSKIHRLAGFAIQTLLEEACPRANSLACARLGGAELVRVVNARSQVVSGKVYEIEAETSAGTVRLKVYEQSWTSTLELMEAALTTVSGDALEFTHARQLALDFGLFEAFRGCVGGMRWNECGSPCKRTCDMPSPICMTVCQARCECPSDKPLLQDGRCISEAECPAAPIAARAGRAPAADCVPDANPRCTREYRPVCADGNTYSNRCIAAAACPSAIADGACARAPKADERNPFGSMLIGGAPIGAPGNPALGGHYTVPREEKAPPKLEGEAAAAARACPGCPVAQPDVGVGSKAHQLATFSLASLQRRACPQINSLGCARLAGAELVRVVEASTQVVAGVKYAMTVETSAGMLKLSVFEQQWTDTLILTDASLALDGAALGAALGVLGAELPLDAKAFAAFQANPALIRGASPAGEIDAERGEDRPLKAMRLFRSLSFFFCLGIIGVGVGLLVCVRRRRAPLSAQAQAQQLGDIRSKGFSTASA